MYFEMRNSSLEPDHLPTIRDINAIASKKQLERKRNSRFEEIISIAVMNMKYTKIKPDAFEKGLLEITDNQVNKQTG